MKMNKVILIILMLLPFDMVFAESERYPEQYWIDDDSVRSWSKEKVFPIKQGDYIVALANYALRYCNGELTQHLTIIETIPLPENSRRTYESVKYICIYNGKPIRLIEPIHPPTPNGS